VPYCHVSGEIIQQIRALTVMRSALDKAPSLHFMYLYALFLLTSEVILS